MNDSLLETNRLKGQNALLGRIQLRADGKLAVSLSYSPASGERYDVSYDRVIYATGFLVAYETTNMRGLLFARTVALVRNYRSAARPFIHCFRNRARALARILAKRDTERRRRTEPSRTP